MEHKLVYFGNDTLKMQSEPVQTFNKELKELTEEMFDIMKKSNGIGLAAPQIDIAKQIVTIDLSAEDRGEKLAIINPVITDISSDSVPFEEGCLSVPGIYEQVMRPSKIIVDGYSVDGKKVQYKTGGVLARVFQHEIDHLKGVLFIDHLEEYIRKEYTKELKKIKKMNKK